LTTNRRYDRSENSERRVVQESEGTEVVGEEVVAEWNRWIFGRHLPGLVVDLTLDGSVSMDYEELVGKKRQVVVGEGPFQTTFAAWRVATQARLQFDTWAAELG